jgi:uncharacterized membrane protein YoaK (UPF0700 family)
VRETNTVPFQSLRMPRKVGALLAFAAGVVDASTFYALFGLFVAQVTGSFVLAGVQFANLDRVNLVRTLAIPVFFLVGFATTLLAASAGEARRALLVTLIAEFVLVCGFAAVGLGGAPFARPDAPLALAASFLGVAAMGVQSALVRYLARDHPTTNVMTTNTTSAAVDIAEWWLAVRRTRRAPQDAAAAQAVADARRRFGRVWPVIAGFLAGTTSGALAFYYAGFWAPLLAIAALAGVIVWAARNDVGPAS